jgi:sec-independent protein translocase protein TatB
MFDIGWSELLVIAVVAIVVVGPKDLPKLMRGFGHYAGKLRRAASDFQHQFEEAMRESEVEEVRKAIESVKTGTPSLDLNAPIDKPMMLPKPAAVPPAEPAATAKPARQRSPAKPKSASIKSASIKSASIESASTKPKTTSAKRGKARAERGP